MRTFVVGFTVAAAVLALGCGSDGSSSSGSSGTPGTSASHSSEQTCKQSYLCVNGACRCTGAKNKDQSCCDPDSSKCASDSTNCANGYCEVCESASK